MFHPYRSGGTGLEIESLDAMRRDFPTLAAQGWQLMVHAIGDRAVSQVLDAYATLDPGTRRRLRCRLEHAQTVTDRDIERFAALEVIASIQPIHMHSDATWAERVVDDAVLPMLFRWRDLADATLVCSGSDFPIDDPNPWHGLATAIDRRDARERSFFPAQALRRNEAIASYTTGVAMAGHQEKVWGKLEPGFLADVIAIDRDPFIDTEKEIWKTEVNHMWVGGQLCAWSQASK